jgi:sulfur-carrier protein
MTIIHLRFFASLREQLGCAEETVTLPSEIKTMGQLRAWLIARGDGWKKLAESHVQMAYQYEQCSAEQEIAEGGEVAFFPPVTGG